MVARKQQIAPLPPRGIQRSFDIARGLNDKLILCIDPGELTGFCTMAKNSVVREIGNFTIDEMYTKLTDEFGKTIQLVIMEEFITGIRAAKLIGSRNEASIVIGIVSAWANHHKIPVVMQMPGILVVAEKMSGKIPKGAHKDMHWMDAFNHGFYWLHSVGLAKPVRRRVPSEGPIKPLPKSAGSDRDVERSGYSSYTSGGGPSPKKSRGAG